MGLSRGMRLGSCEILDLLGAGGMGEVYRGRDTKLGRDVAVKALPEAFAQDADRMARFEREAQILAALNHPNLAVIHELKEAGGSKCLILELVEGETLAERIARGPLAQSEALEIARQIADGLEAAHDKGIVHRDLKPANIKITPEGRVKVLDFGLAKIHDSAGAPQDISNSPTFSAAGTAAGVIMGTAPYMSPEQARGKEVDRRADVWAFGCVLYEMLAGRRTFPKGETVSDTIAGILVRDPDWQALPATTSPRVRALLERCLRKDARRRWGDMADVRIEIEEALSDRETAAGVTSLSAPARRREAIPAALAILFFLTAAGTTLWFFLAPAPQQPSVRMEIITPPGASIATMAEAEISPDGRKLAFLATSQGKRQIWIRPLDAAAQPLSSTDGVGANVFWSADSEYVAFFAERKLKKVAASGGPAQVVSNLPAGSGAFAGAWNREGVILLGAGRNQAGPLLRVPAAGGDPAPATQLDAKLKETSHGLPHFLPDGRHFLYLAQSSDPERGFAAHVGTLGSNERRALAGVASEVKYSATGHVVFIRDGTLVAQPFDAKRLELTGDAFPVADRLVGSASEGQFSVSSGGRIAYFNPASNATSGVVASSQLAWFDRTGRRIALAGPAGEYGEPELSPDGKYVAFVRGNPADVWVLDIDKGLTSRLTSDAAADSNPRWSPDGRRIAFQSNRTGVFDLYERAVGVVGDDKLLLKSGTAKALSDWSRDGRHLAYTADGDVWALPVSSGAGAATPLQLTKTTFNESAPRFSPDGRWIAYVSDEPGAGRTEVYVQSFPEPGFKQQVSTDNGDTVRWNRDGKELYYRGTSDYRLVSIKAAGAALVVGAPAPMHPRSFLTGTFSVSADGRFLRQVSPGGTADDASPATAPAAPPYIVVLLNWSGKGKRGR